MPIKAENEWLYRDGWAELSQHVRFERAGGVCEFCEEAKHGEPHPRTGSKVVLTTAHLRHNEMSTDPDDFAAMCQLCHLTYDAPAHRKERAATRLVAGGQLAMFSIDDMADWV